MFDNISKFLIEQYSRDFASWLIGEPIVLTGLKPSELSLEPIRANALILLQSSRSFCIANVKRTLTARCPFG